MQNFSKMQWKSFVVQSWTRRLEENIVYVSECPLMAYMADSRKEPTVLFALCTMNTYTTVIPAVSLVWWCNIIVVKKLWDRSSTLTRYMSSIHRAVNLLVCYIAYITHSYFLISYYSVFLHLFVCFLKIMNLLWNTVKEGSQNDNGISQVMAH